MNTLLQKTAVFFSGLITTSLPCYALEEPAPPMVNLQDAGIEVDTLAQDLVDPAGIAVDPRSGAVFVAEPQAGRIAVLYGGVVIGALRCDFHVSPVVPDAAGLDPVARSRVFQPRLHRPIDLAFDRAGRLYVAESAPGGRILAFDVPRDGFRSAAVVALSSVDRSRAFTAIALDPHDRLCAISCSTGGHSPAPLVEVFAQSAPGRWERQEAGPALPFPFASDGVAGASAAQASAEEVPAVTYDTAGIAAGCWSDPVLAWLNAQPTLWRVAMDPRTGDVYASMRKAGTVVKIRRTRP